MHEGRSSGPRTGAYLPGLIWTLVRTDFKTRYHGTFGGYLWALAKPVTMFVVLLGVFSLIFSMDPNYNLNLIIGLFLWDFFAESTRSGLMSLHAKTFLLTKARFPTWIVPLTACANALVTVLLFSAVVCSYVAIFRHSLGLLHLVAVASYILALVLIVTGISLGASVLFLRYRDLNQVWDLMLQVGFFIAPVIYPLNIIPEKFHVYLYLWPPTPVIQFVRLVLVEGQFPTMKAHALLAALSLGIFAMGAWIYRSMGPRAVEAL